MFGLKPSLELIGRILRKRELTYRPRKRYQKKQDLKQVKARCKTLSYYQVDTKHLYDISHYWPYMRRLGLPKYQYTIRDVKPVEPAQLSHSSHFLLDFSDMFEIL